jgi:hypothetical protein
MASPEEQYPLLAAHAATDSETPWLLWLDAAVDKALAGTKQETPPIELPLAGND